MQDAQNGPRMDEDLAGPRHGVAGGLVGYKFGIRGEVWGLGEWQDVAKGKGTSGASERIGTGEIGLRAPGNRPVGLGY